MNAVNTTRRQPVRPFPFAAAVACLLLASASAPADTSAVRFIPASCQLVLHVDLEKWNAEGSISSLVGKFFPTDTTGPNARQMTSIAFGLRLGPQFSLMDIIQRGQVNGIAIHAAIVTNEAVVGLEEDFLSKGMVWREQNGRRHLVNNLGDFTICVSEDRRTSLFAKGECHVEQMIAAASGANAATNPGFGAGANAGTIVYFYGIGLARELSVLAPFVASAFAMRAGGDAESDPLVRHQADLIALSSAQAIEFAISANGPNFDVLARVAADTPQRAESIRVALGLLLDRLAADDPRYGTFAKLEGRVEGTVAIFSSSQPKAQFGQALSNFELIPDIQPGR